MIKRLLLILIIILLLLPTGVALASDTSTALYRGTITVSNNSTATTNVATVFTGNTSAWMDVGYVNSSVNNTAILSASEADLAYMPGYGTNPWCLWVPSIGEDSYINDTLYTGGTDDMTSMICYFPDDAGMTTSDDATLEISDNGSVKIAGYFDASVADYILEKENAFTIEGDGSGNYTASIYGNEWVSPTSYYDPSSGWNNETNAYDDNTGTYADTSWGSVNNWGVYLELNHASLTLLKVRYFITDSATYGGDKVDIDYYDTDWHDIYEGGFAPDDWTEKDVPGAPVTGVTKVRVRFYLATSSHNIYLNEVDFGQSAVVSDASASDVSSGDHTFEALLDGTYMHLYVDSVETDNATLDGASVPDNDNDWVSFQNGVMPYVEYQEIYVGGELRQHIEWEYGTNFEDSSGFDNDATPTFRTTSSDADVSAELVSFAPVSTARAPAYSVADAPYFYTGNITATGNFTSGEVPAGGPPGSEVIDEAAEAGGTPNIWLWGLIAIFSIAVSGLFLSYMEKRYGSGGGTLIARVVVASIAFGLLIAFGKFDWWMLVVYLIIVAAIIMWSQHREWGGSVTQHGLIGFLAMSWVGMTLLNRIMQSQLLTVYERTWANNFAFTQEYKAFDVFTIPVLNFSFFTQGIPSLMRWDYSFFGGNAQLFQYLLYSFTAVVSFIIFGILIGLLFNAFRAR